MNLEQAKRVIADSYKEKRFHPEYPVEAERALREYYNGERSFPVEGVELVKLLLALEVLRCSTMDSNHSSDKKRADRARGKRLRKNHTGSRKG